MTHRLFITQHSMSSEALAVYCTCGNLYSALHYQTLRDDGTNADPDPADAGNDNYGVPLSILITLAEKHQNEEEEWAKR